MSISAQEDWKIDCSKAVVCVDQVRFGDPMGTAWNARKEEGIPFNGALEMVNRLEKELKMPQAYFEYRTFQNQEEKAVTEEKNQCAPLAQPDEVEMKLGEKATFIIQVLFRQNATWQGTIQWVEAKKTRQFRSTLEMLKLMDSAFAQANSGSSPDGDWDQ